MSNSSQLPRLVSSRPSPLVSSRPSPSAAGARGFLLERLVLPPLMPADLTLLERLVMLYSLGSSRMASAAGEDIISSRYSLHPTSCTSR